MLEINKVAVETFTCDKRPSEIFIFPSHTKITHNFSSWDFNKKLQNNSFVYHKIVQNALQQTSSMRVHTVFWSTNNIFLLLFMLETFIKILLKHLSSVMVENCYMRIPPTTSNLFQWCFINYNATYSESYDSKSFTFSSLGMREKIIEIKLKSQEVRGKSYWYSKR